MESLPFTKATLIEALLSMNETPGHTVVLLEDEEGRTFSVDRISVKKLDPATGRQQPCLVFSHYD